LGIARTPTNIDVSGFTINPASSAKLLQEHRQEGLTSFIGEIEKHGNARHRARAPQAAKSPRRQESR
jgi:hypothetical protein